MRKATGPGKILGSIFIAVAIFVAVIIAIRYQVSTRMERVSGKLSAELDSSGKSIYYTIGRVGTSRGNTVNVHASYQYIVNGKFYQGTRLSLNGNSFGLQSEDKINNIIAQLANSSEITVWYDPKHPDFSVIVEPQIDIEWSWLSALLLLAWLSFMFLDRVVLALQRRKIPSTNGVHSDAPKGGE